MNGGGGMFLEILDDTCGKGVTLLDEIIVGWDEMVSLPLHEASRLWDGVGPYHREQILSEPPKERAVR